MSMEEPQLPLPPPAPKPRSRRSAPTASAPPDEWDLMAVVRQKQEAMSAARIRCEEATRNAMLVKIRLEEFPPEPVEAPVYTSKADIEFHKRRAQARDRANTAVVGAEQSAADANRQLQAAANAVDEAQRTLEQLRRQSHPELRAALDALHSKHRITQDLVQQVTSDLEIVRSELAPVEAAFAAGDTDAWAQITALREQVSQLQVRLQHAQTSEQSAALEIREAQTGLQRAIYQTVSQAADPTRLYASVADDLVGFAVLEHAMAQIVGKLATATQRYNLAVTRSIELATEQGERFHGFAPVPAGMPTYLCRRVVRESRVLRPDTLPEINAAPVERQGVPGIAEPAELTEAILSLAARAARETSK